jgi:hypothetical protein
MAEDYFRSEKFELKRVNLQLNEIIEELRG